MPNSSDVTAGTDIVIGDHNSLRKDLLLGGRVSEAISGATTVTLDFSDVSKGNIKRIDLDQNIDLLFSGILVYPSVFFVQFVQDPSGGHTVTVTESGVGYPGGSQAPVADGANETTGWMFVANSVGDYDCYYAGFGLLKP